MKRMVCWLGVVLGVVLCGVGLVAVWVYYPQGKQKTVEVYEKIDDTLEQVDDRIQIARERVVTINAMTSDFRASLTDWLTDRQLDQEHIGRRAEIIASQLHQTRDGLGFAASFLEKVRSAQRLAHPFKKQTDTEQLDNLLEELDKVQEHVAEVVQSVDEIRQQAEDSGDTAKLEATIEQSIGKIVQVMEIIDSAEDRLENLSEKVTGARIKAEELEVRIQRDLRWGRSGTTIVLPWMALGQIALCILAWRRFSSSRETETSLQ